MSYKIVNYYENNLKEYNITTYKLTILVVYN
jgi:hypothetical protein